MANELANNADHDLLIRLDTQMGAIRDDIQKLSDNTFGRLATLEQNSINKSSFDDHEQRIRKMEKYQWLQMGAAGAVGGLIIQAINLISGTISVVPH